MRRAALLLLLFGCDSTPQTATLTFGLDADALGPISRIEILAEPGGRTTRLAPFGDSIFVPISPGQPTQLTVTAFDQDIERWRGRQMVPALRPQQRLAAALEVDPVGRLVVAASVPLAFGPDGPTEALPTGRSERVVIAGDYLLFAGEPESQPQLQIGAFTVVQAAITRLDRSCAGPGVCRVGAGRCAATGIGICDPATGTFVCPATPGLPAAEECNGVDDDCDGSIDEGELTQPCYDGPAGTAGVGECRAGVARCVAGRFGECTGQVLPDLEVCDGRDESCTGTPDFEPGDAGEVCVEGVGACTAMGSVVCVDGMIRCTAEPGAAGVETCNAIDDDCDDRVDEAITQPCYQGPEGTAGIGQCREGAATCTDGAFGACDGQITPAAIETCDGVDETCTGVADDGPVEGAGGECAAGVGACAAMGVIACRAAILQCDAEPEPPGVEVCNDIDDDCDGQADEGEVCRDEDCARACERLSVCAADECAAVDAERYTGTCQGACGDDAEVIDIAANAEDCPVAIGRLHALSPDLADLCGAEGNCDAACGRITDCATELQPEDLCPDLAPADKARFFPECTRLCGGDPEFIQDANQETCADVVGMLSRRSPEFVRLCGARP